uniref:Uncharacterized protein n=1 Tax=Timema tahoe TaxID=61484 RepID=A0A7R9NX83_9NEOP|nr:unnamed protein product [Timema tahoe]
MATGQQFNLKWNNHTNNILQVFMDHLSSEQLVDCTLSCQGQFLKAHKMVLSACSPYFQELFRQHQIPHPIIIMNGMKFIDIKLVVEFMYRGEIKVLEAELEGLLAAAETLQVKGLSHVRTKYEKGDIQGSSELQQQQQVTVGQPPASPGPDKNPGSGPTPLDTPIETEGRPTRNCTPLHLRRKRRKSPHNPMEDPLEETITTLGDRRSSSGNIQFTKVSVNDFVDNNDDDLPTTIKVEPPEIRDIDEENSGWGSHKLVIDTVSSAEKVSGGLADTTVIILDIIKKSWPQSNRKVPTGLSVVLQPGGVVSKTSLKHSSDVHSSGGSDFKMSTKRIMQPLLNKRGKSPGNVLVPQWHKKPAIAGKIPRPPNAFMIFANEWRRKLAYQYPDESNKDISCRLGIMWKNMSVGSKEGYYTASRAADVEHKRKYPGYYYSPMEARLRKHIKHGITAARRSGRIPRLPKVIPLSDPDFLCLSDLNGKAARWKSIRPGRPPGRKPKDLLRKMMKAKSASPEPPLSVDKRKMEESQESPNSSNNLDIVATILWRHQTPDNNTTQYQETVIFTPPQPPFFSGHCGFAPVSSSLASGFTSYCVGNKMAAMMWTATSMDSSKGTGHYLNFLPPWIHERHFSCAVNTLAIVSLQYCSVNYQLWNNGQCFPNWWECSEYEIGQLDARTVITKQPTHSVRSRTIHSSGFTTMPQERVIIALCVAFFLCSPSVKAGDIVYEYGGQESLNVRTISSGNSGNGNTLTRCICTQENTCKSQAQMRHNDGSGQIDIRIVTRPPVGLTCSGGLVYCCTNTSPQVTNTCGLREQINVPGVILQEGQVSLQDIEVTAIKTIRWEVVYPIIKYAVFHDLIKEDNVCYDLVKEDSVCHDLVKEDSVCHELVKEFQSRVTQPLYCLDRSTVHVVEDVRDECTSIHSAKENSASIGSRDGHYPSNFACTNGKPLFLPLDKARQQWRVFNTVIPWSRDQSASQTRSVASGNHTYTKERINRRLKQVSSLFSFQRNPPSPPTATLRCRDSTLPPTATLRCRDSTLPPTATLRCRDSTLPPTATSRCRDFLMFHRDSRCRNILSFHRDSRCRNILPFHRDSRCRNILPFHRDSRCRNILMFHRD